MKVLFIGGSGVISRASTRLALERGLDLWLLNRGRSVTPAGAKALVADLADPGAVRTALAGHTWDSVVQWIAFSPEEIERDLELFRGRTKQYIFVGSASAYQKPLAHPLITESTPLANPFWEYSRQKIACEDVLQRALRNEGFPGVIVRPSLTYGDEQIPLVLNAWSKPWTAVERMRRGRPMIVPGDGTSLWTITHNSDFAQGLVGLLGHAQADGHAFHITSDEALTWNRIFQITAEAAGVATPPLVHIASDFLVACVPAWRGTLLGDKAVSAVFDNTKIKRFVPGFTASTSYAAGIRKTIDHFDATPALRQIDTTLDATWDKLLAAYDRGLTAAREEFST